ncbi:MAG: hypothetical protein GX896_10200 [Clostridiales bacterium]|nr:hypothetical protein [Clostridiales bacterium]
MNLSDLIRLKPKWLTSSIKYIKRGRNHFYIDDRNGVEYDEEEYRIVKPIASARGMLFFVCPCCQRIHFVWIRDIIQKGDGYYHCMRNFRKKGFIEEFIILDISGIDLKEELRPKGKWC